jgi:thiol-disulfide isomerase/thioredoxin
MKKQIIFIIILLAIIAIDSKGQNQSSVLKKDGMEQKDFRTKAAVFHEKLNEQLKPQILDARSEEEFDQAHLPQAIQIDPAVEDYDRKLDRLIKSEPVFLYSIQTGRSTQVANLLAERGFETIYVLAPGISAWIGAGYPVEVSVQNKNRIVLDDFKTTLKSQEYVLVDFGSNYCPPCKKVIPVLDSLNSRSNHNIKTVLIEIDANPDIIKDFKITSIPTLILYKDGEPIWKKIGVPTVEEIVGASVKQ